VRIGDLNKRVEIQAPTKVSDGMGGFVTGYSTLATVFCAVWPVSAADTIVANATTMVVTHRLRIRYRSVLKTSYRIKFGTRYFSIVSIIDPNTDHKFLDLLVKEAT